MRIDEEVGIEELAAVQRQVAGELLDGKIYDTEAVDIVMDILNCDRDYAASCLDCWIEAEQYRRASLHMTEAEACGDVSATSAEVQAMAPAKVISPAFYSGNKKKALGKKDKYNKLGENRKHSIKERKVYSTQINYSDQFDKNLLSNRLSGMGFIKKFDQKYRQLWRDGYTDYYLIVNCPGFDGNAYQIFLMHPDPNEVQIEYYLDKKVIGEDDPSLVASYEALYQGYSHHELDADLTDIDKIIERAIGRERDYFQKHPVGTM